MALIDSKQLNPKFTGSFSFSGSLQSFISDQVVVGSQSGSNYPTAHASDSLTVSLGDKGGLILPTASTDLRGSGATAEGMAYLNTTDGL